jgi:hypothetical protein
MEKPRGQEATHLARYNLWFIGSRRETTMNGKLAVALALKSLAGRQHIYAIGPIE